MRSWPAPDLPRLPATGPEVALHDTQAGVVTPTAPDGAARMYVCGITPYDATHLGHAATYVAFDLLHRAWRNAGHDVTYVQYVTDVDDPLLERATQVGVDHGVGFHTDPKLRTVLWGWAGEPLREEELGGLHVVAAALDSELGAALEPHLTPYEIEATRRRVARLIRLGTMPVPRGDWPAIPWPPF